MKTSHVLAVAASAAFLTIAAYAADTGGSGSSPAQSSLAATHLGVGKVLGVDAAQRLVTIAHEDIPGMNMPAMTMDFPLHRSVNASQLKPGQTVAFILSPDGGGIAVTAVREVALDSRSADGHRDMHAMPGMAGQSMPMMGGMGMMAKCQEMMSRK